MRQVLDALEPEERGFEDLLAKKPVIVFRGHPSWRSAIRGALQLKSLCQNHHGALNSTGFSQPRRVPPLCVQATILNLGQPGWELDRILWVQPLI